MTRVRWTGFAVVISAGLLALSACSSSSHATSTTRPGGSTRAATGSAATLTGPVTGGKGISLEGPTAAELAQQGYTDSEYFASGTAHSYKPVGTLGNDGHWRVTPDAAAPYRTRIVVRTPQDPKRFNGTVLVEWLNVTAGIDAAPDFTYMNPELMRSGYAWVGVSVQQVGVTGGEGVIAVGGAPSGGLHGADPARYASLQHPGDVYADDIYSQVGRAIRSSQSPDPLGSLRPQRFLAVGESQSAFELTTYINAFQPTAHVYDGFFVHSRGGGATPITGGNITAGINGAVRIRDDIDVPVLLLETETDEATFRYFDARQPDTDHIRLWDVAGGSHADTYIVGGSAAGLGCTGQINDAPTHYVVAAALHQLNQWVRSGTPPPSAPRMKLVLVHGDPVVQRDALGVAIGGVRTAAINVPIAAYSGIPPAGSSVVCSFFGSTHPFSAATLARLYPSKSAYVAAFTKATDAAIARGYVLPADRAEILAQAASVKI
jgi:hypothetical protein